MFSGLINRKANPKKKWQPVWGFTHLMQISAFQIEIYLLINTDLYFLELHTSLIEMQISIIETEIHLTEMYLKLGHLYLLS